jgi:hypothetical protein
MLQITLTPHYGDADLYVTLDGSQPNSTHYDYMSAARKTATDQVSILSVAAQMLKCRLQCLPLISHRKHVQVTIRPEDAAFQKSCAGAACSCRIAVVGVAASTEFLIVATASHTATQVMCCIKLFYQQQQLLARHTVYSFAL